MHPTGMHSYFYYIGSIVSDDHQMSVAGSRSQVSSDNHQGVGSGIGGEGGGPMSGMGDGGGPMSGIRGLPMSQCITSNPPTE